MVQPPDGQTPTGVDGGGGQGRRETLYRARLIATNLCFGSGLQSAIEERQAHVHAIVDARVAVVELLVDVSDVVSREFPGQASATVVNVELIPPAAVDEDAAQRFEILPVLLDHEDGVVCQPSLPARLDALAGLEIERYFESVRGGGRWVVGGCHGQHHQRHDFVVVGVLPGPDVRQEAADAAVVNAW